MVMLAVGIAALLSAALGYDKHTQQLETYYSQYEEAYGVDVDITQEDFNQLTQAEQDHYLAASEAFGKDENVLATHSTLLSLTLTIVSVSLLVSILTVYFVVPLFFSNGQTLGKKAFGLSVVRSNCVKASNGVLFIRAFFGLYTIETMFPALLIIMIYFGVMGGVGTVTIGLLGALQVGVLSASKNRSSIHDLLTDTVVVDHASQRIFPTQAAREEYIKAWQKEQAEQQQSY